MPPRPQSLPSDDRRRAPVPGGHWRFSVTESRQYPTSITAQIIPTKAEPKDIDAVVLLADDFEQQISDGNDAALELDGMLLTRRPEEIFAAEDTHDWDEWVEFFSRTRESDGRRKGLVEIEL